MFTEFLMFNGSQHRTHRLNSALVFIYQNSNKIEGKKKDKPFLTCPKK